MHARHILFILLLAALPAGLLAQTPPLPGFVAKVPVPELPPGTVNSLLTTPDGMLWIGTDYGLCRFDGINLDQFRHVPGDSTSLPGNSVRCLLSDTAGGLWVGGIGLSFRDPATGHFERIPLINEAGTPVRYECLELQRDASGTLWAACLDQGVMRYDPARRCLMPIAPRQADAQGRLPLTNTLLVTAEGLWSTNRTQLFFQDLTTGNTETFDFRPGGNAPPRKTLFTRLEHLPADPDGLWVGGWGLGLVRFDKRTRTFEGPYLWSDGEPTLNNLVYGILPWGDQGFLIAGNNGLKHFDHRTRSYGATIPWLDVPGPMPASGVHSISRSADGAVWAGGHERIGILVPGSAFQKLFDATSAITLFKDPVGDGYWMSCYYHDRRLVHTDSLGRTDGTWQLPGAEREKYEPFHLLATRQGDVFIGSTRGLLRKKRGASAVERLQRPGFSVGTNGQGYCSSLFEQGDGSVLIGTVDQGIWHWDPATDSITAFLPVPKVNDRLLHWGVITTQLDDDHLLLSFDRVGIGVADLRTRTIRTLTADDPRVPTLGDLTTVVPMGHDIHVVTRTSGVLQFRWNGPDADTLFTLVKQHGVPGQREVFTDAVADADGNIWVASSSGMLHFRPSDGRFVRWGLLEGFPLAAVSRLYRDGPSHLIAQSEQVVRFDPRKANLSPAAPRLYLRSLVVNGREQPLVHGGDDRRIRLAHDQNTLTIGYAAVDLLHAEQLHYEVMLEGRDVQWVDNGVARSVTYVDLPPGEYRLAVRVKEHDTPPLQYTITIVPAFWQTWWFRLLVVLASVAVVFLVTRYIVVLRYRRRIAELQREQEVQRTRMRIARDIHDGIGGGLTRIALLSRRIPDQGPDSVAGRIADASTELVRELGEIVWTVDPGNDARSAFLAFVRNTLGRQFDELGVHLVQDLHVPEAEAPLTMPPDVKRNTILILKEAVNNALKHAAATEIQVHLHLAGDQLDLSVRDNGSGFDPVARSAAGNGLSNLRKRAEAAGGTLRIDSVAGQGTTVHFHCRLGPTFM